MASIFPGEDVTGSRGQTIWTGPDGIRDYKAHVVSDYEYVGETVKQSSTTTSMKFLNTEPKGAKYPSRRSQYVGEVGWMVDDDFMNTVNDDARLSGNQIQLKVYRKALEEQESHRFQNPYVPPPGSNEPIWPETQPYRPGVSGYSPGMPLRESLGFPPIPKTAESSYSVQRSLSVSTNQSELK